MIGGSFRERAGRAAAGELAGVAGSYGLRFVSTLILSRLLFPDAFGLAAIVAIFNFGLVMLSDVGLLQSVVQHERGDDQRFLDTVWTLQVVRGVILWCLSCALAWPMAAIYGEPDLLAMIPVGAVSVLVAGFASTSLLTLRRRLAVARLVRLELGAQSIGLIAIVTWAYASPSAWAMVAGGLVTALCRTGASHMLAVGYRNRFAWDPVVRRAVADVGKWVYGSSALTFVGRESDRLLLGHFMGMGALGIYTIAGALGDMLANAVERLTRGVLFPLLSQVKRDDPTRLRDVYYKARLRLDIFGLVPLGVLMATAQTVVAILYDPRYIEAGWMLQALCVRAAMHMVLVPVEVCLFSMGQMRYAFYRNIGRSVWILVGVPLAWTWFGLGGVVWVTATSEIPGLFILWRPFIRAGFFRESRELLACGLLAVGVMLGYLLDAVVHAIARASGIVF